MPFTHNMLLILLSISLISNTTAQTCDVSFSYRYWKNLTDEASLPKPLLERLQGVLANQVERKLLSKIPKVLSRL